jgi:1-deoxy-D-xylulose 5-phosphate reductoisomerase
MGKRNRTASRSLTGAFNQQGNIMARDLSADIDRLTSQLADLRSAFAKQASASADDASSYLIPRAKQVARQFRHGSQDLTEVARRNPGTTTGAVVGALVLTAAFAFLLSKAGSDRG